MKLIYIILGLLLTGCASLKKNTTKDTINEVNISTTPKIIFLNYKITKGLDKTIKASLSNKIIVEGRFKKNIHKRTTNTIGDFICIQLDKNLLAIDSLQIPNPLIQNIEYLKPSGAFGRKQVIVNFAELPIRMQLSPFTKFISLKRINNPNTTLLKIQL